MLKNEWYHLTIFSRQFYLDSFLYTKLDDEFEIFYRVSSITHKIESE